MKHMHSFYKVVLGGAVIILFNLMAVSNLQAQCKVTFQVNLKPQLKDSTFIPGRDIAYMSGDLYPMTKNKNIILEDTAPVDSIFSVEVHFPSYNAGKRLNYNYIITSGNKTLKEKMIRKIDLKKGDEKLTPLYFDSYAW